MEVGLGASVVELDGLTTGGGIELEGTATRVAGGSILELLGEPEGEGSGLTVELAERLDELSSSSSSSSSQSSSSPSE